MTSEVEWICDDCDNTAASGSYAQIPAGWESTPDRQLCPECLHRHNTSHPQ